MVHWLKDDDLERFWKNPVVDSQNLPGGPEEYHQKPQIRIAGVTTEVRTDHLSNTRLERYRYTNQLGGILFKKNHVYTKMVQAKPIRPSV
jgi:hypothetical protein